MKCIKVIIHYLFLELLSYMVLVEKYSISAIYGSNREKESDTIIWQNSFLKNWSESI